MDLETIHIGIAIGTAVATVFLGWVGLKIKIATQDISGKLDTHVATDELKFQQIDKHFEFTDGRVDRLERSREI